MKGANDKKEKKWNRGVLLGRSMARGAKINHRFIAMV